MGTFARTTSYGGIPGGYGHNLRRLAQATHTVAQATHRPRINLGSSRKPKKAIYHPQHLLLIHQKILRVVCGGPKKAISRAAKIAVLEIVPTALVSLKYIWRTMRGKSRFFTNLFLFFSYKVFAT